MNKKWRFYKMTNLTVTAVLLKDILMGRRDGLLPKPLLKIHAINCLTFEKKTRQPYEDNLCILRALALPLHGNQKLEKEKFENLKLFMNIMDRLSASEFHGALLNNITSVEDLLLLDILLSEIDNAENNIVGDLCWRSMRKHENSVRLSK